MLNCKTCGAEYEPYGQTSRLCRACYREYMRVYMLDRYRRRRAEAIETLGGKCIVCGSVDQLELDHKDQFSKHRDFAKILTSGSQRAMEEEIKKAQLLCYTCHRAKTREDLAERFGQRTYWVHGTLAGYRHCRCPECKEAKRIYSANYRKTRVRS